MSDSKPITSAGRLRSEVLRLKEFYESNNITVFKAVQKVYGERAERWARSLAAFEKIALEAKDDIGRLEHIDDARRNKYAAAIGSVRNLVGVAFFNNKTSELLQHTNELILDRLEALEESSISSRLGKTIEAHKAGVIAEELAELIEEIKSAPTSEIDPFLLSRLEELAFVLSNYALFGPDGVEHAVEVVIGGGLIRAQARGSAPPEPMLKRLKRVARIAKGALDVYVYSVQAVEGIEWSQEKIKAIGEWLGGAG